MYDVIKDIETNNNPLAIGDGGKAYGVVQIHKIAVDDVNRIYGTSYTHEDSFDISCAEEIFYLYLQAGIRRYTKKHRRAPTEEQVVRMWNGGIYKGYKKSSTIKYYRKYEIRKSKKRKLPIKWS